MQVSTLSANARKFFNLIEFDDQEELVAEIRKHPVGLAMIYVTGSLVSLILFFVFVVGGIAVRDGLLGTSGGSGAFSALFLALGLLLITFSVVATAIGAYLYQSNVVLVTSEKIAQLLYRNLFNRKISQLSIGDVQDVTVSQKGILAHMFNYGTIVIETAGEQQNYTFTFAPKPYENAKAIVGAHERNLVQYGN